LQDALVRRDFQLNGMDSIVYDGEMSRVQAVQNAAEARVYGMQAKLDVKMKSGFGFSSQINIQKGEEEMDDGTISPSRHAAPTFGVTRLSYSKGNLICNSLHNTPPQLRMIN
jgi:hemoglobin/transferrin/lactoferrin receptor protein